MCPTAPPWQPFSLVCRSKSRARCHNLSASLFGSGVNWTAFALLSAHTGNSAYVCSDIAGSPGRICWENFGMSCRVLGCAEAPLRRATGHKFPRKQVGTCFFAGDTQDWGSQAPICVSSTKGPAAPLIGRRWHVYGSGSAIAPWHLPQIARQVASLSLSRSQVETDCHRVLPAVSDTRPARLSCGCVPPLPARKSCPSGCLQVHEVELSLHQ